MTPMVAGWLEVNRTVYLDNATARRDFRVQLRGFRSVLLLGLFLLVLIGLTLLTYWNAAGEAGRSVVDAQWQLKTLYQTTMNLLGGAVLLVAPGLTATTIVMERQRQSIDLVFSAPVTPKYYLVGKMLGSFRYTWMLLVLALPVTAAAVVLGGASWSDVLVACILLSLQGLMLTAFALLMLTFCQKPMPAIIWSYVTAIVYAWFSLATASVFQQGSHGMATDAPFEVCLSPFAVADAAKTYTTIFGYHIPNWLIALAVALLVVKICLLGAGSLLNPGAGKEVVGLRVHGLLYTLGFFGLLGWYFGPEFAYVVAAPAPGDQTVLNYSPAGIGGCMAAWCLAPLIAILPLLACHGFDRERRYRPNGLFKIGSLLDGTPAGGLPFLLALLACAFGGFAVFGRLSGGVWPGGDYWRFALFGFAFWVFVSSVGRLLSSYLTELKAARTALFVLFLLVTAVPYPLLITLAGTRPETPRFSLWDLYILCPIVAQRPHPEARAVLYAGILLALSLAIALYGELRTHRKVSAMRDYDRQPV